MYIIRQKLIDSGVAQRNYRGLIVWGDPDGLEENIGYYTPGDFDKDGDVDFADFAIFATAWLTGNGDVYYRPTCDVGIPADNSVGPPDLAVFVEQWLVSSE